MKSLALIKSKCKRKKNISFLSSSRREQKKNCNKKMIQIKEHIMKAFWNVANKKKQGRLKLIFIYRNCGQNQPKLSFVTKLKTSTSFFFLKKYLSTKFWMQMDIRILFFFRSKYRLLHIPTVIVYVRFIFQRNVDYSLEIFVEKH